MKRNQVKRFRIYFWSFVLLNFWQLEPEILWTGQYLSPEGEGKEDFGLSLHDPPIRLCSILIISHRQ